MDFCEFKASLVYRVSSRTGRIVSQRNFASKTTTTKRFYRYTMDEIIVSEKKSP